MYIISTYNIYVYMYIYIHMHVCVCVYSTSQGTLRIIHKHQTLDSPLPIARRVWTCQNLDFRLLAHRTVKR